MGDLMRAAWPLNPGVRAAKAFLRTSGQARKTEDPLWGVTMGRASSYPGGLSNWYGEDAEASRRMVAGQRMCLPSDLSISEQGPSF